VETVVDVGGWGGGEFNMIGRLLVRQYGSTTV
jgi:hypothetical protein